jgi:hypothetical protein
LSRPGIVKISFMDMPCNQASVIQERTFVEQGNESALPQAD